MIKPLLKLLFAAGVALLAGCASNVPELIRAAPEDAPELSAVRGDPAKFEGRLVRWGGEVIEVTNQAGTAWIEVLARPLWRDGPPRSDGPALGRFLARAEGFVDPVEYAAGNPVTITGRIVGAEERNIGDHPYRYPLVAAEARHLWPKQEIDPYRYYYSPLFYDPWWPYRYRYWGPHGRW